MIELARVYVTKLCKVRVWKELPLHCRKEGRLAVIVQHMGHCAF